MIRGPNEQELEAQRQLSSLHVEIIRISFERESRSRNHDGCVGQGSARHFCWFVVMNKHGLVKVEESIRPSTTADCSLAWHPSQQS